MNLHQRALTILATAGFQRIFAIRQRIGCSLVLAAERSCGARGPAMLGVGCVVASASRAAIYCSTARPYWSSWRCSESSKRSTLLMLSPWVLLPVGVAIETAKPRWATFALAAALLIIGAAGWYGIYSRRYYSAPRFIEPWQEVAGDAAAKISRRRNGDRRPSFISFLSHLFPPRTQPKWAVEIRGLTSRFSQASAGLFPGGLACRRASNGQENDPGSTWSAIREETNPSTMRRGNWTSPAVPYRLVSGCVTKGTSGNSDFPRSWVNPSGESKFVNTIATHQIPSRSIPSLRADSDGNKAPRAYPFSSTRYN